MASIIKRKKNYSIVYTYVDENGETKQKWETRTSYQEALKRKAEIESQKSSNSFLPPTNQNIAEFLSDFVSLYGEKRWGVSMYDSQNSLIANYINPIIGDMKVQDITESKRHQNNARSVITRSCRRSAWVGVFCSWVFIRWTKPI